MKMTKIEKRFVNASRHAATANRFADEMMEHVEIDKVKVCLEVGCGVGLTAVHLATHYGLHVTGVDVDLDQIELAKTNGSSIPDVSFRIASATKLPFDDDRFDLVFCYMVLHHVDDWLGAILEMKRVLKPKGYLIYGDIISALWLAKVARKFTRNYGVPTLVELNKFIRENELTECYSSKKKTGLFGKYEAVYRN